MSEKVLILQTAFLGDLILSTSFFHAVRKVHPDAIIHLVCNLGTEQILEGNPDLNLVIPLDKKKIKKHLFGFISFALGLRKEKYTIVYAAHFSFRSSLMSYLTGAPVRVGYAESGFSFLHTKTVPRPKTGPHEVEKLFSLLPIDPIDYPKDRDRRPFLFPKSDDISSFRKTSQTILPNNEPYIILAPSSLWETKRLPEEKFVSIISQILRKRTETIVLIGSKADEKIQDRIFQLLKIEPLKEKERARLHSLIGKNIFRGARSLDTKCKRHCLKRFQSCSFCLCFRYSYNHDIRCDDSCLWLFFACDETKNLRSTRFILSTLWNSWWKFLS